MEPSPNARTVQSYEEIVVAYAEETSGGGAFTEPLTRLAEAVPAGHVLDVGSGPGWDADELEDGPAVLTSAGPRDGGRGRCRPPAVAGKSVGGDL